MKIIIVEKRFYKNVPKDKLKEVFTKTVELAREIEESNYDSSQVAKGFKLDKIESLKGNTIYKYYYNLKYRVIFTFGKFVQGLREEDKNSLVLLSFSDHDNQIDEAIKIDLNIGNKKTSVLEMEENDKNVEECGNAIDSDIFDTISIVTDSDKLEDVFGEEKKFKYLMHQEQFKCLEDKCNDVLLLGPAGSGKTTISLYKAIDILENNQDNKSLKICYITYSETLKNDVIETYENLRDNLFKLPKEAYEGKIYFYTLNEYLEKLNQSRKKYDGEIYEYKYFKKWFEHYRSWNKQLLSSKLSPFTVWKEMRGLIKGLIGANWFVDCQMPSKNFDKECIEYLRNNNTITVSNEFFRLNEDKTYSDIDDILRKYFGSDSKKYNDFMYTMKNEYNLYVQRKNMLTKYEYLNLRKDYSIFDSQREIVYNVVKKYCKDLYDNNGGDKSDYIRNIIDLPLSKFDYLIVDEIQDLTELELYFLHQIVKDKNNLFFSGDANQTINPTYFRTQRIKSIFVNFSGCKEFKQYILKDNYRSTQPIVNLANNIKVLRKDILGDTKNTHLVRENGKREGNKKPTFICNKDVLIDMVNAVENASYSAIIVPDEEEKDRLLKEITQKISPAKSQNLKGFIFTVQEIKGIEKKTIITYNIISKYKKEWKNLINNKINNEELYGYYFNVLYVSITRARDNLCLIEDNPCKEIVDRLKDNVIISEEFNISEVGLEETSSDKDFFMEASDYEAKENYEQAIGMYKTISSESPFYKRAHIAAERCEIKIRLEETKDYEVFGEEFLKIGEFKLAAKCFRITKDYLNLLNALVNLDDGIDIDKEFINYKVDPLDIVLANIKNITFIDKFNENYLSKKTYEVNKTFENINNEVSNLKIMKLRN